MDPSLSDESAILQQAAERAQRLLDHLVRDGGELGVFRGWDAVARALPDLADVPSPGLLAEGEALLRRASESARQLADDLRTAAANSRVPSA